MRLKVLSAELGVVHYEPDANIPAWVWKSPFFSITRTAQELSIFCETAVVPENEPVAGGWRALFVVGPISLELYGVLASLAMPLASRQISIFSISTHDTDYLLVPADRLEDAIDVLHRAGHEIER